MERKQFKNRKYISVFSGILLSLIISVTVYPLKTHSANIEEAEYFMDKDPGEGSGISLGSFNAPEVTIESAGIDVSGLTIGPHTIYVRFKNSDGIWGAVRPMSYDPSFASPFNFKVTGDKWIADAEYFIDIDPGEGNGTHVSPKDGSFDNPEEVFEIMDIDISYLTVGLHTLYLRLRDSDGAWGILRETPFEVYEQKVTITGAEYFFDNEETEPGSGSPITAKDGLFDGAQEDVELSGIDISGLSEGVHTLYVRFKDSMERWGAIYGRIFAIGRPIAYISSALVQPPTGDGLIPLSVVAFDQSGNNTCRLKIEYSREGSSDNWRLITIKEGSVIAEYGNPALDNTSEYQIGNSLGWIQTSSGPNTVSFIWDSMQDLGEIEATGLKLRFTIDNGIAGEGVSTESTNFVLDTSPPSIPLPIFYLPDPTGDTSPTIRWNKVPEATRYHLQIATDTIFDNILVDELNITATSYTPLDPLPYGYMYWRVSAFDVSGNESGFSPFDVFLIKEDADSPTVILYYSSISPVSAGPLTITAVFSETISTIPEISIDQPGNEDIVNAEMSGYGTIWTYTYDVHCAEDISYMDGTATVTITNAYDYAGNENLSAQNYTFTIDTSDCGSGNIIAAEYFIDKDPGEGRGISLGSFNSPEVTIESAGIDVSNLTIGPHTIYVRFKNSDGIWGAARPMSYDPGFASPFNFRITGDKWIADAEYFIDIDPGEGNGTHVSPKDGSFDNTEEVFEIMDIDISYLTAGLHTLYLRLRDSDGVWGILREKPFEVYEQKVTITGAEYFFDNEETEPGSGSPITAKDGLFDGAQEDVELSGIDISGLSEGVHTLYVRFKDSMERWGAIYGREFTIISIWEDADGDGMPNGWESEHGLDPIDPSDADEDLDMDDLSNINEYENNTNPNNPDTDGDDMPDGWEIDYGLAPADASDAGEDLDNDGLVNKDEYLHHTDPNNPDTDGDGMSDGDEVNYGSDPSSADVLGLTIQNKDVLVSLQGDNRLIIEVKNRIGKCKTVEIELYGFDPSWYTIQEKYRSFKLMPFESKVIYIQLHLPPDCNIPTIQYPFTVEAYWQNDQGSGYASASGTLTVTPNPNVYPLAVPDNVIFAGNTIFTAWRTDIPATGYLYYRKLGDTDFIQAVAGVNELEHRVIVTDLEFFTYYEFYTENFSACGGRTVSKNQLIRTGKAVKFVDNINEFWIDRDYSQNVTLSITNTDIIPHKFQLSIENPYEDIIVGFVGDGSPGREATLEAGESYDVELVIHAQDAEKTLYDLYLKIISDNDEVDRFVDYSHAVVHVRPFVANLDIQPVQSDPGMMTSRFRLINYGDTISDIEVYVDETNRIKKILNPSINHYRLTNGEFIEFDIKSGEYINGTVYAQSNNYIVSATFEIGCPPDSSLKTFTINDVGIVVEIKDWYCTNKMRVDLPFAVPMGFDHSDLSEAALEVNFSLPMAVEKYDPHSVHLFINGHVIASLEDIIPEGKYLFRFPPSLVNLGFDAPAQNILAVEAEGIGEGHYIVVTDFKIFLNISEMNVNLCVPPIIPPQKQMPLPETKIKNIEPNSKFRPGETAHISMEISNNDNTDNDYEGKHRGRLTVVIENNSYNNAILHEEIVQEITVLPGEWKFPDDFNLDEQEKERFDYNIPEYADDIEYTIHATFENYTMNAIDSASSNPGFWVRSPLIIVHGIMGSRLRNTSSDNDLNNNVLWMPNAELVFTDLCDEWLNELGYDDTNNNWINPDIEAYETIKSFFDINSVLGGIISSFFGDVFYGLEKHLHDEQYFIAPENQEIRSSDDVFYFSYDWRMDNSESAEKLKEFVEKVTNSVNSPKINLLAHSMGGLVSKSFIEKYFMTNPDSTQIDKVIFVGTPHLGVPDVLPIFKWGIDPGGLSFYFMLFGDQIDENTQEILESLLDKRTLISSIMEGDKADEIKEAIDSIIEGPDGGLCDNIRIYFNIIRETRDLIADVIQDNKLQVLNDILNLLDLLCDLYLIDRYDLYLMDQDINFINDEMLRETLVDWPSMYQLLPSQRYFNEYLYFYKQNENCITDYIEMKSEIKSISNVKEDLLDTSEQFHETIDNMDFNNLPVKSYNIAGCRKETTEVVSEEITENKTTGISFIKGDGDGRVPINSALGANVTNQYAALDADHMSLPSQRGIRLLIRSLLKGYETGYSTNPFSPVEEYSEGFCDLPTGIKIKIPIILPRLSFNLGFVLPPIFWPKVTGPGGSITCYTGNKIHLGILGSDYRITNEGIEIFVPEGSVYTLKFHGMDQGYQEYIDIKLQLMSQGGIIKTYVFFDIPIGSNDSGEIDIDLTDMMTDPILRLDKESDGVFEETGLIPSYVMEGLENTDFIPPETVVSITGTTLQEECYIQNVSINFTATDNTDGSGVLVTKYRLQGGIYQNYTGTVQISEPGDYMLTYYSRDRNLNEETEKILEFKICNIPQLITGVEDEGPFSLNKSELLAKVYIDIDKVAEVQEVFYSVGTSPGLTDIVVPTSAGTLTDIHITDLSLIESCDQIYFINAQAKSIYGIDSEVVSSNGIRILDPASDNDGDGFDNETELTSKSNPCNKFSYPGETGFSLNRGFNLVSFPAETLYYENIFNLLKTLDGSDEISYMLIFDPAGWMSYQAGYDDSGQLYGQNLNLPLAEGTISIIFYAKQSASFTFTSRYCPIWDLKAGINLVGTPCASEALTAFQLLQDLGKEHVTSIQRFNMDNGRFETASYFNGKPTGIDFPIIASEAYIIYMEQDKIGFVPY